MGEKAFGLKEREREKVRDREREREREREQGAEVGNCTPFLFQI